MFTFFSILLVLLAINGLLLIFSVNGAMDRFKKPVQKIKETPVAKLLSNEYAEAEYKKAV